MRTFIITLISMVSFSLSAQQNLVVTAPGEAGGNYGTINFVDMSALGHKQVENISYADVFGSPFWNDDWNAALFILSGNRKAKVQKAKLNLYTNEVHFISKEGTELSLDNTTVQKVIFFKGSDTTTVLAVFVSLADSLSPNKNAYYRVLNNGKYVLLELNKVFVRENEYNPTSGSRDHSFFSKTSYAISDGENITAVKLSQSHILSAVHPLANAYDWISQNKNKLKTVPEIISFLNYYNSTIKL